MHEVPLNTQRKFVQLYEEGLGLKRIARKTRYSYSGIRKCLLKSGVALREPTQLKVTPKLAEEFQKLYEAGWTMREISAKFDVSWRTVQRWLHRYGVRTYGPGRPKRIPDSASKLTEEKAYILGVMGPGDGCFVYDKKRGMYLVKLDVIDKEFAAYFAHCLKEVYKLQPRIRRVEPRRRHERSQKHILVLQSKAVCDDLCSYGVSFRESSWRVPAAIKNSSPQKITRYLRGVADSQGCVSFGSLTRQIIIASKNTYGLEEIQKLLSAFDIRTSWVKSRGTIIGIRISNRKSLAHFSTYVGFIIKRKKEKLERVLATYKRV